MVNVYIKNQDTNTQIDLNGSYSTANGTGNSQISSFKRSKDAPATTMPMPKTDEDMNLVMGGFDGTTGKYTLSGIMNLDNLEDLQWSYSFMLSICNGGYSKPPKLYDPFSDVWHDIAIDKVDLSVEAGEGFIIRWNLSGTIGIVS